MKGKEIVNLKPAVYC